MGEPSQVEPRQGRLRRRDRSSSRSGRRTRGRLRLLYFSLASLWGMIAGTVAVAGALTLLERPIEPHPILVGGLVLAVLLAVAGGAVAANAYRQAARR